MDIRHVMDPQSRRGLSHVLPGFPQPPLRTPGQVMKNVATDELLESTDAYMTDAKVAPRACFGHTTLEQTSGA